MTNLFKGSQGDAMGKVTSKEFIISKEKKEGGNEHSKRPHFEGKIASDVLMTKVRLKCPGHGIQYVEGQG